MPFKILLSRQWTWWKFWAQSTAEFKHCEANNESPCLGKPFSSRIVQKEFVDCCVTSQVRCDQGAARPSPPPTKVLTYNMALAPRLSHCQVTTRTCTHLKLKLQLFQRRRRARIIVCSHSFVVRCWYFYPHSLFLSAPCKSCKNIYIYRRDAAEGK